MYEPIEPRYCILGAISVRLSYGNQIQFRVYYHVQDDMRSILEPNGLPQSCPRATTAAGRAWVP